MTLQNCLILAKQYAISIWYECSLYMFELLDAHRYIPPNTKQFMKNNVIFIAPHFLACLSYPMKDGCLDIYAILFFDNNIAKKYLDEQS